MVSFNKETQGAVKNALVGSPHLETIREETMSDPAWIPARKTV